MDQKYVGCFAGKASRAGGGWILRSSGKTPFSLFMMEDNEKRKRENGALNEQQQAPPLKLPTPLFRPWGELLQICWCFAKHIDMECSLPARGGMAHSGPSGVGFRVPMVKVNWKDAEIPILSGRRGVSGRHRISHNFLFPSEGNQPLSTTRPYLSRVKDPWDS